jgi:tetratricopeptide (TPR) repeat protein
MLHLSMFGGIVLLDEHGAKIKLSQRDLLLVCYFVTSPRRTKRDEVVGIFWPRADLQNARHSLSQCIYRVNQRSRCQLIVAEGEAIRVDPEVLTTDHLSVLDAIRRGRFGRSAEVLRGRFLQTTETRLPPSILHWADRKRCEIERRVRSTGRAECEQLHAKRSWRRLRYLAHHLVRANAADSRIHFLYSCGVVGEQIRTGTFVGDLPKRTERLSRDLIEELREFVQQEQARTQHAPAEFNRPFVGRTAQLELVRQSWTTNPRHNLVVGPAGVGKTMLLHELLQSEAHDGATIEYGRCARSARSFGYAPFVASLSQPWAIDALKVCPPQSSEVIARWIEGRSRPTFEDATSSRSPLDWWQFSEAVSSLFDAAASTGPFVYCLDDVQWSDMSTIGMILRVARYNQNPRVRILLACRTEDDLPTDNLSTILREASEDFNVIKLQPFTQKDSAKLIRLLGEARGIPIVQSRVRRIIHQSGGLPLFVAELAKRHFEESGKVQNLKTVRGEAQRNIIESYLDDRLAGLNRDAARLADTMAAHSGAAPVDEWSEIAHLTKNRCRSLLAELVRTGLVEYRADMRYSIAHDLIKDAIYSRMRADYKRMLHHLLAEGARTRGHPPSIVAYHYDASGQKDSAFIYSVRGANDAMRRYAYLEAADLYRTASRNCGRESTRLRLLFRAAVCHISARDLLIAREQLRALKIMLPAMDARTAIQLQVQYAFVDARISDRTTERRSDTFRQLYADPRVQRDARLKVLLLRAWIPLGAESGDYESLPPAEEFFAAIRDLGDSAAAAIAMVDLGKSLCMLESAKRALPVLDEAMQLAGRIGDPISQAMALGAKASVLVMAGDLLNADLLYGNYRDVAERLGVSNLVLSYWNNRAMVFLERGECSAAHTYLKKAAITSRRAGAMSLYSMAIENMHIWCWETGRLEMLDGLGSELALAETSTYSPRCARAVLGLKMLDQGVLSEATKIADSLQSGLTSKDAGDRAYIEMLIARVDVRLRRSNDPLVRLTEAISTSMPHNFLDALRMQVELANLSRKINRDFAIRKAEEVVELAGAHGAKLLEQRGRDVLSRIAAT